MLWLMYVTCKYAGGNICRVHVAVYFLLFILIYQQHYVTPLHSTFLSWIPCVSFLVPFMPYYYFCYFCTTYNHSGTFCTHFYTTEEEFNTRKLTHITENICTNIRKRTLNTFALVQKIKITDPFWNSSPAREHYKSLDRLSSLSLLTTK